VPAIQAAPPKSQEFARGMDDLIAEFLTETNEALADLDTALVVLERDGGGPDTIANIFRMVHTVKGTSGLSWPRPSSAMSRMLRSPFSAATGTERSR
jgi:chemotaxis protein histidine kinase CheA